MKVEIKAIDFGWPSEYVNITVNGINHGKCSPPGWDCTWYQCPLENDELIPANGEVHVIIRFSEDVDVTLYCDNQAEARITLQLEGNTSEGLQHNLNAVFGVS